MINTRQLPIWSLVHGLQLVFKNMSVVNGHPSPGHMKIPGPSCDLSGGSHW